MFRRLSEVYNSGNNLINTSYLSGFTQPSITKSAPSVSQQVQKGDDYDGLQNTKKFYLQQQLLKKQMLTSKYKEHVSINNLDTAFQTHTEIISNSNNNGGNAKIYNRATNPPMALTAFTKGIMTTDVVITPQIDNKPISSDYSRYTKSTAVYNFYDDLPDTTAAPFNLPCLQHLFLKVGGSIGGTAYPTIKNIGVYNNMSILGNVKQYFYKLANTVKSTNSVLQRKAMVQLLGILPESLIRRVPYIQGVEVIWFKVIPGKTNSIAGILKRSIETDITQFQLKDDGMAVIQMFDLRAAADFTTKYTVVTNGGFFIAINTPFNIAQTAFDYVYADNSGLFANLDIPSGPKRYTPQSYSSYFLNKPNITKLFFTNSNGGNTFQFIPADPLFIPRNYSLTLERGAPFINFEVNAKGDAFDDTRNPGLFTNLITQSEIVFYNRPEERDNTPGKKGFIRIINSSSYLCLTNIAYQSWGGATFAFRLQSMPVKDAIFSFWVYNKFCVLYLVPLSGSMSQMKIRTNINADNTMIDIPTNYNLLLGEWYLLKVSLSNDNLSFDINCDAINNIIHSNIFSIQPIKLTDTSPIITDINNGLQLPNKYGCNIGIGGKASGFNLTGTLYFDLAWIHFFDYVMSVKDVVKDCEAKWAFTQYPDS